jgi:hypothetical protein
VPAIKPFFALAFPIAPALYKRIAAAHAADARKKVRPAHCLLPVPPAGHPRHLTPPRS